MIEAVTGKQAITLSETAHEDMSPFGIEESWVMDTTKARSAGFTFLSLAEWLPELVALLQASLSHRE
ncbi:hypothetical protein D3C75_988370 [compost metagenome]